MVLGIGAQFERPFRLEEGGNAFACIATYIDGAERPFDAYWTCPMFLRTGGVDLWSVHGSQRRSGVTVHASLQQERYQEIACWAFRPDTALRDAIGDIPHDSTGFDYSAFK